MTQPEFELGSPGPKGAMLTIGILVKFIVDLTTSIDITFIRENQAFSPTSPSIFYLIILGCE